MLETGSTQKLSPLDRAVKWWRRRESNHAGPLTLNNLAEKESVKTARIAQNLGSRYITGTQNATHFASSFHPSLHVETVLRIDRLAGGNDIVVVRRFRFPSACSDASFIDPSSSPKVSVFMALTSHACSLILVAISPN
jgi:hypothetical protein